MKLPVLILAVIIFYGWPATTKAQNFNGTYMNSARQQLQITNHIPGESFQFEMKWGVNDEWGCMFEAQGVAWFKDQGNAYFGENRESAMESPQIAFNMQGDKIQIDPSGYTGMDCMKFGDSFSEDYTLFKKAAATAKIPVLKARHPSARFYIWEKKPAVEKDGPTPPWTYTGDWCEGPQAGSIRASSTLAPQGKFNYKVTNLIDDNPNTAWVEASADYGIGQFIEMEWPIIGNGTIGILNGYQSSKVSWENNSRVKKLKISVKGKDLCMVELGDVMGIQEFVLPESVLNSINGGTFTLQPGGTIPEGASPGTDENGNATYTTELSPVRFTIMEVYPGLKWKDTAISEIFNCGG